jgi:PhoH-like ATPase
VNLRIRADALGLTSMDFEAERIDIDELYSGMTEMPVRAATSTRSTRRARCRCRDRPEVEPVRAAARSRQPVAQRAGPFRRRREEAGAAAQAARRRLGHPPAQQGTALRAGPAAVRRRQAGHADRQGGDGKTMLALAAGLQKVVEEQLYSKLLVSRPIFPLGRDVGYLPGDIEEKLNPWMQPIYDNVEFLMGLSKQERKTGAATRS